MGIHNLDIQNKCLLSKWLFKLCNEDGLWQELLRNKYLKGQSLSQIEKKQEIHILVWPYGCQEPFLGRFKLFSGNNQITLVENRALLLVGNPL